MAVGPIVVTVRGRPLASRPDEHPARTGVATWLLRPEQRKKKPPALNGCC